MLSREDNEVLTKVGPGTKMGDLIRRFWIPALLASEVNEPDGAPVRVTLLGEALIAFRSTDGRVGLLEEGCPHRRASLALGLNADNGIRCLYHGWKFGVDGQCEEAPTEPASSSMCSRVKATAYLTREAGGVIWAYMGPVAEAPPFPNFDWLGLPSENSVAFKVIDECNYAQAVEGTIDSAHAGSLHREVPWDAPAKYEHERDLAPKIEVEYAKYGYRYGAVRNVGEDQTHIRVTQVVYPFFTLIPPTGYGALKHRRLTNAFVPRDDNTTWHFQWFFDETQPIDVEHRMKEGGLEHDENFRKLKNKENNYGQDRSKMKTDFFSGIPGILLQDHAVTESMGPISDRTKENLGASDIAVVAWRRQMIRAARTLADTGAVPSYVSDHLPWERVKAQILHIPASRNWKEELPLEQEFSE